MSFASFQFPIFFLIFTLFYFALPSRFRRAWLLLASCGFYMVAIPAYILVLFALIIVDYSVALAMEKLTGNRRKWLLCLSVLGNVGMLFVFKYFDFFISEAVHFSASFGYALSAQQLSLVLPVGLSFHTFQSLGYVFEVYYRRHAPERDLMTYALYVLFWPQLVAGPIERPQSLLPQLRKPAAFLPERFSIAAQWMLLGFIKKMVIADRLGNYVDPIYAAPTEYAGAPLVLATYCFAFQIYCDFSGYTDIARGAAKILGVDLMKNFNFPYLARSVSDFWSRWHISLSTWFRDYLYIPLGGSRGSAARTAANIFIVFLVSGLWHGANWTFVLWGALHGLYLIGWRTSHALRTRLAQSSWVQPFKPILPAVSCLVTFHLVVFAWIFFRANSVSDAFYIVTHLFHATSAPGAGAVDLSLNQWVFRAALIGGLWVSEAAVEGGWFSGWAWQFRPVRWAAYYAGILLILAAGIFSETKFIYFQF
jgi:alginate O-acetyltransferase complex protein AlgI